MHSKLAKTLLLAMSVVLTLMAMPMSMPAALSSQAIEQSSVGTPSHYIVFLQRSDGSILPLYHRSVTIRGLASLSDAQLADFLAKPSRNQHRMVAKVRSAGGQALFQSLVEVPQWLRGEFAAEDGVSIDGHFIDLEESVFVVRVPIVQGATLVLAPSSGDGQAGLAEFDLDRLAAVTPTIDLEALQAVHATDSPEADPANRVDLLIMGDGYTAAQQSDFEATAQLLADEFLDISPLAEYANYVTVHTLFTPSNQAGADHPPYSATCSYYDPTCCGDPLMLDDPLQGTMVSTAFDSRYCVYYIHRLLAPNFSKVYAAAGALPDWDKIILLVNDTTYGGSGGSIATISTHAAAVEIARHEFGHSFADLADEYDSAYPGYPSCSDIDGPACEPNVTDVTDRAQIKWNPWIEPTTPVPTPEESAWTGYVGLFEGARYMTTGMYRPGLLCIMRSLGQPFCQVPSQTYVLKLYDGGWGVPSGGISLIEPGTAYPASPLTLTHPAEQTFGAEILQPVGGSPVEITWLVNGLPVPGENEAQFTYTTQGDQLGDVEISLQVRDVTPLVHPEMAGDSLQSSYTWLVEVLGGEPTLSIGDASADESDGAMVFPISLSVPSTVDIQVSYATSSGAGLSSATPGTDYYATSGTLTIPAGASTASADVDMRSDPLYELDETFYVTLSEPVNVTLSDSDATGTILNNDEPPEIEFETDLYTVGEEGATATLTVTLSGPTALVATVDYATVDGTLPAGAKADEDYSSCSDTIEFLPGEGSHTIIVDILNDTLPEFTEAFEVILSGAAYSDLGSLTSAVVRIADDDAYRVYLPLVVRD